MKSIAFLLPVRKNSQRVKNKMLRPFADSSLFEIYLDKIECFKNIAYVVAYEQEFIEIAKNRGFRYIRRSKESANGETSTVIHNYLKDVKEDWIFMATGCCPLMKTDTLKKIMVELCANIDNPVYYGLITAKTCGNVIWDEDKKIVNKDAHIFNTKRRRPLYIETSSVFVFRRKRFLDLGIYWGLTNKDPNLYIIDSMEAIDIDTMTDFEVAEILYKKGK